MLPYFVCWEVWKARDLVIFEERQSNPDQIACWAISSFLNFNGDGVDVTLNIPSDRRNLMVFMEGCKGCFDGASLDDARYCNAGAIIYLDHSRIYTLWMNCGVGTSTRGELLGIWLFIFFAKYHNK